MMEVSVQANVALLVADFVSRSMSDDLADASDRFERLPITPENFAGFSVPARQLPIAASRITRPGSTPSMSVF
jgi:hypothetical protein